MLKQQSAAEFRAPAAAYRPMASLRGVRRDIVIAQLKIIKQLAAAHHLSAQAYSGSVSSIAHQALLVIR